MTPLTKVCSACGIEKELTQFHKNKNYRLGVTGQCKLCRLAAIKMWRKANPEKVHTINKRYYATDKGKALWKRHRIKHAVRRKATLERWRQNNPERIRWHAINRIVKRRGLSREEYDAMFAKQNGKCAICGQPEERGELLAIDHNHTTDKNRGLLCERHNLMLGLAGDSSEILRQASYYLDSYS